MEALRALDDQAFFHLFTTVSPWFFKDAIGESFTYHHLVCDVGFVQSDPFSIDFSATQEALTDLLPFRSNSVDEICRKLAKCNLVICDISPLGIYAARKAGIASVLVENFTWDHLYAYYLSRQPCLARWIELLAECFALVDYHIQTEPLCQPKRDAALLVGPISRDSAIPAAQVKKKLGTDPGQKIVLISFGGFPWAMPVATAATAHLAHTVLVVPTAIESVRRQGNVVFLPRQSEVSHVAVVQAADALICKAGYSTLAEGYCAGVPVAAILRDDYPETSALAAFVEQKMGGRCLSPRSMTGRSWLAAIPRLFEQGRHPGRPSEAGAVARFLLHLL